VEAQYTRPYHAIKESLIFLPQLQLAVDSKIVQVSPATTAKPLLPPWMQQMKDLLASSEAMVEHIALLLGDRGYFCALTHVYSYLGMWNPQCEIPDNPRMVTPQKLWGKKDVKWTYLSDPSAPVIHQEMMVVNPDHCKMLGNELQQLPCDADGNRCVPVAIVAGFDCYRKPGHARDFHWAHERAQKINIKLVQQANKLASTKRAYVFYCKKYLKKTVQAPSFKGRRRVTFKNLCEKALYLACYTVKETQDRILKEKSKLCGRLYFYSVSLQQGETIDQENSLFLSIPEQFRQRWGTESDFNGVKHRFPLITNDRSPTARHARWVLGHLMENSWHYARFYFTFQYSSQNSPSVHFSGKILPEIRKTSDAEFPPELTAQGYLLSNLRQALNKCLQKSFRTSILC
jgi:hypothetical protein